jgi:hypothetical protein
MEEKDQQTTKIKNLVVARFRNGKTVKGITYDFGPQKKAFHVISIERNKEGEGGKVSQVFLSELKAVFFVKSLEGRKNHLPGKEFLDEGMDAVGAVKVKITFIDGEILIGTTHGYNPERKGFFIVPPESDSNNLRVFVVSSAIRQIETWK